MENYIEALKKVPECHLALIDLAWQLVNEHGELDDDLLFHNLEVHRAVKEATAHVYETRKAVASLCALAHLNLLE